MRILNVEVSGLLGRQLSFSADFNADLNIVTGKNGAGKTSLLKLIWYTISGNILLALQEVTFDRFRIRTDLYDCTIIKINRNTCKAELFIAGRRFSFEDRLDQDGDVIENAEDALNPLLVQEGSSVFFPTFRRIEGGFTLTNARTSLNRNLLAFQSRQKSDIEDALSTLSKKLTHSKHLFVSAISTADIVGLLLAKFADLSQVYNELQQETSDEIISDIKTYRADNRDGQIEVANQVLDQIITKIEQMEGTREGIMAPIEAVNTLVTRLFINTGIKIDNRLSFGDAATAVNSDLLSAGEKQMLSFISYNAFSSNSVVLIDEPELSLHVDWQRQLFPILLSQQSSNQFIIATHSPFIYGKYPDKELQIDLDRGDSEVSHRD